MPYTLPTVDDLQARFPVFATADEYVLSFLIDEAAGQIDDSWLEKDYARAIMYLAAHLYVTEQGAAATRPGTIQSESFGPISRTFAVDSSRSDESLRKTEYGRRYADLRKKNFPGVVVV